MSATPAGLRGEPMRPTRPMRQQIGAAIRKARGLTNGMDQQQLAVALGHRKSYSSHVSKWERGEETAPLYRLFHLPDFGANLAITIAQSRGVTVRVTLERAQ